VKLQEITITGEFKDRHEDFLEKLAALIEDNFDCELVGLGIHPVWDDDRDEYAREKAQEAKNLAPDSEWRYKNWDYDG